MYSVTNPATSEVVEGKPTATDAEIRDAMERAYLGYLRWRWRPGTGRELGALGIEEFKSKKVIRLCLPAQATGEVSTWSMSRS